MIKKDHQEKQPFVYGQSVGSFTRYWHEKVTYYCNITTKNMYASDVNNAKKKNIKN